MDVWCPFKQFQNGRAISSPTGDLQFLVTNMNQLEERVKVTEIECCIWEKIIWLNLKRKG